MSVAIGSISAAGNAYSGTQVSEQPPAPQQAEPKDGQSQEQITTVTTHCDKEHQHTQACPHTVSTRPAPKEGEPGHRLDTWA